MVPRWWAVNFIPDVGFDDLHDRPRVSPERGRAGERAERAADQLKARRSPARRRRLRKRARRIGGQGRGKIARNDERICRAAERNGRQLISREILLLPLIFRAELPNSRRLPREISLYLDSPRAERVADDGAPRRLALPSARPSLPRLPGDSRDSLCFAMLRNSRRKFAPDELLVRNVAY